MQIDKAKSLKVNDIVQFPADRGEQAGQGRITHLSTEENKNFKGDPYIWVTVRCAPNRSAVWPSNRLA